MIKKRINDQEKVQIRLKRPLSALNLTKNEKETKGFDENIYANVYGFRLGKGGLS
jgi:hypothetical protein